MDEDIDAILNRVQARIGRTRWGMTISCVPGKVGISWRRLYADGVESDQRMVEEPTLREALLAVLAWEDEADAADAKEASRG